MGRRRPDRKAEWETFNKTRIRDAVISLLSKHGSEGLTMDRVAEEAGVAKGTLYVYYNDKKALLETVRHESLGPLWQEAHAILTSESAPWEKVRRFVTRHLEYFDASAGFFRVLLWERQLAEAFSKRHQTERFKFYLEDLAGVIQEGIAAGVFRPLPPRKIASMIIEADMAMIQQRLWSDAPAPVQEDIALLLDVFLHGLAPSPAPAGGAP